MPDVSVLQGYCPALNLSVQPFLYYLFLSQNSGILFPFKSSTQGNVLTANMTVKKQSNSLTSIKQAENRSGTCTIQILNMSRKLKISFISVVLTNQENTLFFHT